ncbi:MAG: hypothetical protein AB4060_17530 [Crocosphaera sp.]
MNSKEILRDTIFTVDHNGHGGNRRTAQIDEIITSQGYKINDLNVELRKVSTTKFGRYFNAINLLVKHRFEMAFSRSILREAGNFGQKCQTIFKEYSGHKILIWEANREQHYIVPYIAKENGFKVIAFPHNLESLSLGNVDYFTKKQLPYSLLKELKHLALADLIFCISREEKWLLNLLGIEAYYFPYYPPQSMINNLLKIRHQRGSREQSKRKFLVIGTIGNPPTRLGMIELINTLKKIHKSLNFTIDIAGYGTEKLKEFCDQSFITLHGTLTPEELNKLLLETSAVLINQKTGVGALTKIPEMLIAGIPIIANITACRSAFDYSGIYCYQYDHELPDLLTRELETPNLPVRPSQTEKHLLKYLQQVMSK